MSKARPAEGRSWSPPEEIDRDDPRQVRKVARRLEADPAEVLDAVAKVGPSGKAVTIYLGMGHLLVEGGHGIAPA